MRKVRVILRLTWSCGQSRAAVAKGCGVSKTTVTDTIRRATTAKLSWPLPAPLTDDALEDLLYPPRDRSPLYPAKAIYTNLFTPSCKAVRCP